MSNKIQNKAEEEIYEFTISSEFINTDSDKGSNKPITELEPLYSRDLYSPYSHFNDLPCYGDYCRNGCWKHFCKRCGRGSNRFIGTCCFKNKKN